MNSITLMVTNDCNFRCGYCFELHKNTFMTEETAKKAVDEMKMLGMHGISFFGGEPLLNWDTVVYVIEYAKSIDYRLSYGLITNGYLLDREKLSYIKENNVSLAISFDGVRHNGKRLLANGIDTTERVYENLKLILELGMSVDICPVITSDGVIGIADDYIELYKLGFNKISPAIDDMKSGWSDGDFDTLYAEYEKILEFIYSEYQNGRKLSFEDIPELIEHTLFGNLCPDCHCKFGNDHFVVDTDGKIYPCVQFVFDSENAVGNIYAGLDLAAIANLGKRYMHPLFDRCASCEYNWYCHSDCACRNYNADKGYTAESSCKFIDIKMRLINDFINKKEMREKHVG